MDQQLPQSDNFEPGKVFVGGLSWDTTKQGLETYFSQWGEVADATIMKDPGGKPRGFGFVQYKSPDSVLAMLGVKNHILDNKKIDPKRATTKGPTRSRKVFIGGLPAGITDDDLKKYFSGPQYSLVVQEVDLKYDKNTGRMRGFGFIGFEENLNIDDLIATQFVMINGKKCEIKKAEPRYATQAPQHNAMSQFPHPNAYMMSGYAQPQASDPSYYAQAPSQQQQATQQYNGYGYPTAYQQASTSAAAAAAYAYQYPYATDRYGQLAASGYAQGTTAAASRSAYTTSSDTSYQSETGYYYPQDSSAYQSYTDQANAAAASTQGYGRGTATQQRSAFPPAPYNR